MGVRDGKVAVMVYVSPETRQRFKAAAAAAGMKMGDAAEEAFSQFAEQQEEKVKK